MNWDDWDERDDWMGMDIPQIDNDELQRVLAQARRERWPALGLFGPGAAFLQATRFAGILADHGIDSPASYLIRLRTDHPTGLDNVLHDADWLEHLAVNNCTAESVHKFAFILPKSLQTLDLGGNSIGPDGARGLAPRLSSALQTLYLGGNFIGPDGAGELAPHLPSSLQTLDLGYNSIGPDGARGLAPRLPSSFQALVLGGNSIGPDGAGELAQRLPSSLQALFLGGNSIGPDGAGELAQHLPSSLQTLDLRGNSIGPDGAGELAPHLPSSLQTLDLRGNSIGPDGAGELAPHLPSSLQTLDLRGNSIGPDGAGELAPHLPSSLQALDLRGNSIGPDGAAALAKVWRQGKLPNLNKVWLHGNDTGLPDEVIHSKDPATIFGELLATAERPLAEVKVLLVGQGSIGKSLLRQRLFGKGGLGADESAFFASPKRERTEHADVGHTHVEAALEPGGEPTAVKLRCWDFGGQNHLHGTHRFFLRAQHCVYVLVLDATRKGNGIGPDSNRLSYWLKTIAEYGGADGKQAPVLLVRTCCDQTTMAADTEPKDQLQEDIDKAREHDPKWYGARVIGEVGAEAVDTGWYDPHDRPAEYGDREEGIRARHRAGCQELVRRLTEAIAEVPDLQQHRPDAFHRLLERLEGHFIRGSEGSKHLTWQQYDRICAGSIDGETVPEEARELDVVPENMRRVYLKILRSLGVALWVGDHDRTVGGRAAAVRDAVVNPHWVRPPAYALLDRVDLNEKPSNQEELEDWRSAREGILTAKEQAKRLPTRSSDPATKHEGIHQAAFDEHDRDIVVTLMQGVQVAFGRPSGHLFVPDLLPDTLPETGVNMKPEELLRGPSWSFRISMPLLTDRLFNRFLGDWHGGGRVHVAKVALCREAFVFDYYDPESGHCRAAVLPDVCPADGSDPVLRLFIAADHKPHADRLADTIRQTMEQLLYSETGKREPLEAKETRNPVGGANAPPPDPTTAQTAPQLTGAPAKTDGPFPADSRTDHIDGMNGIITEFRVIADEAVVRAKVSGEEKILKVEKGAFTKQQLALTEILFDAYREKPEKLRKLREIKEELIAQEVMGTNVSNNAVHQAVGKTKRRLQEAFGEENIEICCEAKVGYRLIVQ